MLPSLLVVVSVVVVDRSNESIGRVVQVLFVFISIDIPVYAVVCLVREEQPVPSRLLAGFLVLLVSEFLVVSF